MKNKSLKDICTHAPIADHGDMVECLGCGKRWFIIASGTDDYKYEVCINEK